MYDLAFAAGGWGAKRGATPFSSRLVRRGRDVTVVATSIMVLEAIRTAQYLEPHGVDCEVIDLHCVSHPDAAMILESLKRTGRLIVADTSWRPFGVAAEICRIVAETDPRLLKQPVVTLGMQPAPCPTAKALEDLLSRPRAVDRGDRETGQRRRRGHPAARSPLDDRFLQVVQGTVLAGQGRGAMRPASAAGSSSSPGFPSRSCPRSASCCPQARWRSPPSRPPWSPPPPA